MFEKQNISQEDEFLVVDFGTSCVDVAYCVAKDGKVSVEDYMSMTHKKGLVRDTEFMSMKGVTNTLKDLLASFQKRVPNLPKEAILICNSDDFLTDTISYNFLRKKPEAPVTYEELTEFIREIEFMSAEHIKVRSEGQTLLHPADIRLISAGVIGVSVDKKLVTHPIGKLGKNVKLTFLNIFGSHVFYESLKGCLLKSGLKIRNVLPVGMSLLNYFSSCRKNSGVFMGIDFGYSFTTLVVYDGHKKHDFYVMPLGYSQLEHIFKKNTELSAIEIQDALYNPKKYTKYKAFFQEYIDLMVYGLHVGFEILDFRGSFQKMYISGNESHSFLYKALTDGRLSPWVVSGASYHSFHELKPDSVVSFENRNLTNITGALLSRGMATSDQDPIIRILRNILAENE